MEDQQYSNQQQLETILRKAVASRTSSSLRAEGEVKLMGNLHVRSLVAGASIQLEGAKLSLVVIPARIECKCGHEGPAGEGVDHHSDMPIAECPRCGEVCRVSGGRGVSGIDLEVEEPRY